VPCGAAINANDGIGRAVQKRLQTGARRDELIAGSGQLRDLRTQAVDLCLEFSDRPRRRTVEFGLRLVRA
jgi:hypothetical protein